jgi:cardiolipin synthase
LRSAGAHVVEFNPLSPLQVRFRLQRLSARNHRKLLLIDGEAAFLGGINIAEQWLPREKGGVEWKDDAVRVRGPVVKQLRRQFIESWAEGSGETLTDLELEPEVVGSLPVAVIAQRGRFHRRHAVRAYVARLRAARTSVYISNAYFLPNLRIRRALARAARRGVDVRIILPARSDVPLIRLASRGIWAPLLAAGVRIYEWQPTILHTKTAIIDQEWVTVGSFNLDYISLRTNRELNVAILDREFACGIEAQFFEDLLQCKEIDEQSHRSRPLGLRMIERVLYWARSWL